MMRSISSAKMGIGCRIAGKIKLMKLNVTEKGLVG